MIKILNIENSKIEFQFNKFYDSIEIKLRSTLNGEIFYDTKFNDTNKDVIYWIYHPRLFIEDSITIEGYVNGKLVINQKVGENELSKDINHITNLIGYIEDDIKPFLNESYYEVFVNDNFGVVPKHSHIYNDAKNIIDLGGNCGFFSRMIMGINSNAKSIIVEPNPFLIDTIKKLNKDYNIEVIQKSFNKDDGIEVKFNFSKNINQSATNHEIGIEFKKNNLDYDVQTVNTINLEKIMDYFNNEEVIDILKVDIEGGEIYLNEEKTKQLIRERVRYVLVETHSHKIEDEIKKTFVNNGFEQLSENPSGEYNHLILKNLSLKEKNKKILIKVPCPAMGDTLCATPTIKKISESYGHKVDVMAVRDDILLGNPYIDKFLNYSDNVDEYHEVFDTYVRRIKVNKNMSNDEFYDESIELKLSNFEARQIHALSVGITLYPDELSCDFYPDEETERSVLIDKNCLVLHVTDSWPNRTWEIKKWQRLIDLIKDNTDFKIVTIGKSHSENGYFGNINKNVIKLENVDYDFCVYEDVKTQGKSENSRYEISEMWHIINNAFGIISFDSGPIHLAGTTDSWIFQIGASIRPEKTAPWRYESQKYKFEFIGGECKIFCGSCPKYSVKEWGTINSMPYYPECQEKYSDFKCQPSPDEVFFKLIETKKNV